MSWLALTAAAITIGSWLTWLWLQRPPAMRRRVVINFTRESHAIVGVLWGARGSWLQVRDAALVGLDGSRQPLDGEQLVHRDQVSFIQVVT